MCAGCTEHSLFAGIVPAGAAVKINSCISKYPHQNAMSCGWNFAAMETPERPQTARSESEPKRLEYRSPSLARLGKLAQVTLSVGAGNIMDTTKNAKITG
jgi:hypothetical protein